MLFFFSGHFQVSEIMSCCSLLDSFRWLRSGWCLRFALHQEASSTPTRPLLLRLQSDLTLCFFCPSRTLCLLNCVPGGSTAISWSVSPLREILPARWMNDDLLSVFHVREILSAQWIDDDLLSVSFPREKFCLSGGSTRVSCLHFL